ncbi:MAG: hypothetical protein ACLGIN_06120 [Candidatus Sericytochromatia bacterium]
MKKHSLIGTMFAATFAMTAIAGCQVPMQTAAPGAPTGAAKVQPATALVREGAALALADERELADMDFLAGQASATSRYSIFSVEEEAAATEAEEAPEEAEDATEAEEAEEEEDEAGAGKKGKRGAGRGRMPEHVRAKLQERQAKHAEKIQKRLEKMKDAKEKIAEKMKGAWVDNGDGTESKRFSFSMSKTVNGKTMAKSIEMERTRDSETKELISSSVKASQTQPNGQSKSSERSKTVNADGSFTVVFHAEHVFKDGTKRVADWTKTVALDGSVSGTGSIVWTDKDGNEVKKTTVTLGGSEDAPEAAAEGETVTADDPEAVAEEQPATEEAAPEAEPSEAPAAEDEEAPAEEAAAEEAPATDA